MQKLDNDWLTTNPVDFEYKKYLLLAYDQYNIKNYNEKKLYPHFDDIIEKIKIVNEFLSNVKCIENSKTIIESIDIKNSLIVRHSLVNDKSLDEVKLIAKFSKEILVDLYCKYRNLLDDVDNSIVVSGCRVEIFNPYSGYIVIKISGKEKILEYNVIRKIHPYPHFILKTNKADIKEYYETRYQKNVFDIIFKKNYPYKQSLFPVFRKKFLMNILGFPT